MDSIVDLMESRKARTERSELFRTSAKDLLLLLERQREHISEEFMTFLLALAVSDQALHYAEEGQGRKSGQNFLDHVFDTARQIYETQSYRDDLPSRQPLRPVRPGRILEFIREAGGKAVE